MSKDAGKTWERITDRLTGFPKWGYVSEVVPSKFDANTVYVTVDGHRENDFKTYIWVSTDMGATFRSLNANLRDEVVRTMIEDTKNPDVLYLGTETGIFLTIDRGKSWRRLKGRNFPTVRVDEMVIQPRDNALVVGDARPVDLDPRSSRADSGVRGRAGGGNSGRQVVQCFERDAVPDVGQPERRVLGPPVLSLARTRRLMRSSSSI